MIQAIGIMRKNRIPDLLKLKDWSIYRLAKLTGLPHHNVSRIVKADKIPDGTEYKTLLALSKALGVSIDELETKS